MIGHRRVGLEEGGGAWVEEALRLRLEVERGGRRGASEGVRHGGWLELSWGERESRAVVDAIGSDDLVATWEQGLPGAVRLVLLLAIVICQVVHIILNRGAEVLVTPVALHASPGNLGLIGAHVRLALQACVRSKTASFG